MNKYEALDKQITQEIMPEFKGKIIDIKCPTCGGLGNSLCSDCHGAGHYEVQF